MNRKPNWKETGPKCCNGYHSLSIRNGCDSISGCFHVENTVAAMHSRCFNVWWVTGNECCAGTQDLPSGIRVRKYAGTSVWVLY